MNQSGARFNNTAIKMNNALFRLLEEKDFRNITVTEICQKAGVNRSTFYAHYDNLMDLLEETEERFLFDFLSHFKSNETTDNRSGISEEEILFITPKYLLPYLEFARKNRKLFITYLKHIKEFRINDIYHYLIKNIFIPILKKHGITDEILISYYAKYYLTGINAITMNWLERDCSDDINLVCQIIIKCVKQNLK